MSVEHLPERCLGNRARGTRGAGQLLAITADSRELSLPARPWGRQRTDPTSPGVLQFGTFVPNALQCERG